MILEYKFKIQAILSSSIHAYIIGWLGFQNPNHAGTNVPRLLELCLDRICDNLDDYDLQDFPDEFLIK